MYVLLWTLLQQKRKSNDIPFYYRIWYRRPEENVMHKIVFGDIYGVVIWILKNSEDYIWTVEESRMLLTDEEI